MEFTTAHGLVGLTLVGSALVHHVWMSLKVGQARKKYGIDYPALYAPAGHKNEKEFNCVQRAHQNSLENLPTSYALLLTAGVKYPLTAAILGCIYVLGRIQYFRGYASGDPKQRMRGSFMYIGTLGLLGAVTRWSLELLAPALRV